MFAFVEQLPLVVLYCAQLLELQVHFLFLGFYGLALSALVGGIFAHETNTSVHLGQVVGTEDKHQLALGGLVAVHIAHRLDIVLLALVQLVLQLVELRNQLLYFYVKVRDVVPDGVYCAALHINLGVDDHEIL